MGWPSMPFSLVDAVNPDMARSLYDSSPNPPCAMIRAALRGGAWEAVSDPQAAAKTATGTSANETRLVRITAQLTPAGVSTFPTGRVHLSNGVSCTHDQNQRGWKTCVCSTHPVGKVDT